MRRRTVAGLICAVLAGSFGIVAAASDAHAAAFVLGGLIFVALGAGLLCDATARSGSQDG